MIRWFTLALLFSSAALAQTNMPQRAESDLVPPQIAGERIGCSVMGEPQLEQSGGEILAVVGFHVSASGTPVNVAVTQSTGNADSDKALIACVSAWRYKPAQKSGAAVDVPWQSVVIWLVVDGKIHMWDSEMQPQDGKTHPSLSDIGPPHICRAEPLAPNMAGPIGSTKVAFVITPAGTVKDVQILNSSAQGRTDGDAIRCVSRWRYIPATANGKPVDFPWQAEVRWTKN